MVDKPSLEYYLGRQVVDVITGGDNWQWSILLEGNVQISNEDKRRTAAPTGVHETILLSVIVTEKETMMNFGHTDAGGGSWVDTQIPLTPTQYVIADDQFPDGPHYPQRVDTEEQVALPDDPSAERIADGPETPAGATEK